MTILKRFETPARQNDFPNNAKDWELMQQLWSTNVDGFTRQCITGNPWNMRYESNQFWYYNALDTEVPSEVPSASDPKMVSWSAFPGRLRYYYDTNHKPGRPSLKPMLWQMADSGQYQGGPFPEIPTVLCPDADWQSPLQKYGPYGPRGWMDEYCEWSVTRRASDNKIVRVDFICENPEYWQTLWRVSPETAAQVYTDTLNYGLPGGTAGVTVTVDDLTLHDQHGQPVLDSNEHPVYNPLNRWNNGTVSQRKWAGHDADTGGAMHLTSTPNTLQTELALASAASVQRTIGHSDPQALICCSRYGQNFRNSDPHIGQLANEVVFGPPNNVIALANPPGLYIQEPVYWNNFKLPDDPHLPSKASVQDCWQIVRGKKELADVPGGNFILHAVFQIPADWIEKGVSFTVGDIEIKSTPIEYGSQIAEQFEMGLFVRYYPPGKQGATYYGPTGITGATAPILPCVAKATTPVTQPLQILDQEVWDGYYNTNVPNPMGFTMNLASNSSIIPPIIAQGASGSMALTVALGNPNATEFPSVSFQAPGIEARVIGMTGVFYAVPGNSYPDSATLLNLKVTVGPTAPTGLQSVVVTQAGDHEGQPGCLGGLLGAKAEPNAIVPAPAFLNVVGATGGLS